MNKRKQSIGSIAIAIVGIVFVAVFLLYSYSVVHSSDGGKPVTDMNTSVVADGTLSDLDKLTVNDNPTPPEKYNRVEQFGPAWKDVDHNGCDTRNDILARDLKTISDRRNSCVITAGQLADPYSGKWIDFRKKDASKVQIDHVVALENAWQSGHDNMAKGSKSADQWMPPHTAYACTYASKQVQIKNRYALTVTTPEKQALADALATCTTN